MAETPLTFPLDEARRLEPHLPPLSISLTNNEAVGESSSLPFVTLTFATSLDSALSLGPGIRTALSGPGSKAMTHYLRSRHDAICVGVGTAIADDPGLNCRLAAAAAEASQNLGTSPPNDGAPYETTITARQPRPIVIDPTLRWDFTSTSKVMRLARAGKGLAPYIVTAVPEPPAAKQALLAELGGKFISLSRLSSESGAETGRRRFDWRAILAAVREEGLRSIMIEGGGEVINSLLSSDNSELLDSVIVTLAPTWLGQGSVFVSPPRKTGPDGQLSAVARLANPTWMPLGEDVVLCGKIAR
ncbi:putative riboflavin biosynthesis protein Rib7 [Biscogniauxia mediterranea]|nr:putative riboflavin biosynthesis protein Rib7 [Biscogniauxia mediterranea]